MHSAVFVIYEFADSQLYYKKNLQEKIIWNCLIRPDECANYCREADLLSPFIVENNILIAGFSAIEIKTVTV